MQACLAGRALGRHGQEGDHRETYGDPGCCQESAGDVAFSAGRIRIATCRTSLHYAVEGGIVAVLYSYRPDRSFGSRITGGKARVRVRRSGSQPSMGFRPDALTGDGG